MSRPLRALTYARVSTSRDQDPAAQVAELKQFCDSRAWRVVEEISDHGYSGGTDRRPGLQKLMGLARARKIDCIVVTKLDRIARSLKHLVAMLDEFNELGITFVSVHDQIDLTTASGRLMLHIIGAFAEFERSLIRERTVAGLDYAKSQGKKLGRPSTRKDEPILALRAQGLSYREIGRRLGVSRGAIYRAAQGVPKTPKNSTPKNQSNQRAL